MGALNRDDMANICEIDIGDISSDMREMRDISVIADGDGYVCESSMFLENDFSNESCGEVIDKDNLCCGAPVVQVEFCAESFSNMSIAGNNIFPILFDQYSCMRCDGITVKCNICDGFIAVNGMSNLLPIHHFKLCGKISESLNNFIPDYETVKLSQLNVDYDDIERNARDIGIFVDRVDGFGNVIGSPGSTAKVDRNSYLRIHDYRRLEKLPHNYVVVCDEPIKFDNNDMAKYGSLCTMTSGYYFRNHECLSCGGEFDAFPTKEIVTEHLKSCLAINRMDRRKYNLSLNQNWVTKNRVWR